MSSIQNVCKHAAHCRTTLPIFKLTSAVKVPQLERQLEMLLQCLPVPESPSAEVCQGMSRDVKGDLFQNVPSIKTMRLGGWVGGWVRVSCNTVQEFILCTSSDSQFCLDLERSDQQATVEDSPVSQAE